MKYSVYRVKKVHWQRPAAGRGSGGPGGGRSGARQARRPRLRVTVWRAAICAGAGHGAEEIILQVRDALLALT